MTKNFDSKPEKDFIEGGVETSSPSGAACTPNFFFNDCDGASQQKEQPQEICVPTEFFNDCDLSSS